MTINKNYTGNKRNFSILFAAKLAFIAFAISSLSTIVVWLISKSAQPNLINVGFTWRYLLIWLLALALVVSLVQKIVCRQPIFDIGFKRALAKEMPIILLARLLQNTLISLLMCYPALALFGFFILSNSYFRYSILSSSQNWLNGYGWFFIVTFIVFLLGLIIGILAVRLSGKRRTLNLAASSVSVIVLCVLAYIPAYHQTRQLVSAVSSINNAIASQRITNASTLNFNAYQPSYIPQGYTMSTGSTYGPSINSAYEPDYEPENFELTYFDSNNSYGEIFIDDYSTPSSYNPPASCGSDARGYYGSTGSSCVLIGSSTLGCNIYAISDKADGNETFCQVGDTIINAYIYTSLITGESITSKAQYNQIVQTYNSMQKLSTEQVQQLIDQTGS